MTDKQTMAHWRLWSTACAVNGWRMERGRLQMEPGRLNTFGQQVVDKAGELALAAHRAPTLDDLRHAVYCLACGKTSHQHLDNTRDYTRIKGWLLLVIDDSNLDAAGLIGDDTAAVENDERRRCLWRVRQSGAPQAYIDHICKCRFSAHYVAPFWEDLPVWALKILAGTLAQRRPMKLSRAKVIHERV